MAETAGWTKLNRFQLCFWRHVDNQTIKDHVSHEYENESQISYFFIRQLLFKIQYS